ncbi:hypothetical protein Poli38472_002520 [Pythium oligandrum]|uniref:Coatomer subunit delta n=1 Tax=Pythium oligandrum TaxID=41045 RepID=A0A8K1CHB9_PYTOL|nr:hypothetical protein Poli38472_002520 [Pythium oligandrum]|eukprot:TMW63579.1 hypothetical protein Poli38472_002520 [Pythium oligandrum]
MVIQVDSRIYSKGGSHWKIQIVSRSPLVTVIVLSLPGKAAHDTETVVNWVDDLQSGMARIINAFFSFKTVLLRAFRAICSVTLISVLVARQFVEITRIRLEGLLTAFPKLLSSGSREHTFIDTESVRYVYQPLENFFVLIITNKTSNIVEDLHTIQLLAKLVPDICGSLNESAIRDKQFELIFGFDELIAAGGHSENVNLQQIRVNMEMESHEEKLHNMILQSKQAAAKDDMKRHTIRIKEEQRERARLERAGLGGYAKQTGFGSSMGNAFGQSPRGGGSDSYSSPTSSSFSSSNVPTSPTSYNKPAEPAAPPIKASGMKLGGASKSTGKSFLDAMAAEDDLKEIPPMSAPVQAVTKPEPTVTVSHDPIGVVVEEKITVVLNREGTLEQLEVKGSLFVSVNDQASACCRLKLRQSAANGITFQTHPKVDKRLFDQESVLGLKDATKPFPSARVAVLRWSLKTQDESFLPLNIVCWPEEQGGGKINVTIEYSMDRDMVLDNVNILIPLGSRESPQVAHVDGQFQHNSNEGSLLWHLDRVDSSNNSGTLEFSIRGDSLDAFFPLAVSFFSRSVYSDVDIEAVVKADDHSPVQFGFEKLLSTENYQIV